MPTLVILALAACGPEPLQFADWIIEIPEGTPVREYAPVRKDERDPDAIRLTEEMVIGADLGNPDTGVFRPTVVVATETGTIFVADFAMKRVQMYDRNGRHLKTLGKEGQGPGEFASLTSMTVAGDLLVIDDSRNDRFSTWTLDGIHAGDHRKSAGVATRSRGMWGLADGTLILRSSTYFVGDRRKQTVTRLSLDGEALGHLDEMVPAPPVIPDPSWTAADIGQAIIGLFDDPRRAVAVGASHIVYVTPVQEYQVLAMAPDATPLWALRVAWPRPQVSSLHRKMVLRQAGGEATTLSEGDLDWPPEYLAIDRLLTDGAGRLYVIPELGFDGNPPERVPADVYSPEGEFLVAGFLPAFWSEFGTLAPPWSYAAGDHVYGLREDESGETVAVRYRLVVTKR